MGTTLTGTTPQDTYDSLIKVTDNGPLSGTAKYLSDGLGNDSALALSTTAVGVGTATPASALHVLGTQFRIEANDPTITLKRNVAAAFGGHIDWLTNDNTIGFQIANNTLISASFLEFNHSGINRMVIKSDGNVGIGTSAPAAKLDVAGTILTNSAVVGNNSNHLYLSSNSAAGEISIWANNLNTRLLTLVDGYARLASGTNGIQFNGDTAAANALDDYEEGTWTMGVSFGDASVGVTYLTQIGNYTKIGRQVTATGRVYLTNKGSSAGVAEITGLPFTVLNNNGSFSAASLRLDNVTFANAFMGHAPLNTTKITLEEITEAGAFTTLNEGNFNNDSSIMVSLINFTA